MKGKLIDHYQRLDNLIESFAQEILDLSDEELMEDMKSIGVDPEQYVKQVRQIFGKVLLHIRHAKSPEKHKKNGYIESDNEHK